MPLEFCRCGGRYGCTLCGGNGFKQSKGENVFEIKLSARPPELSLKQIAALLAVKKVLETRPVQKKNPAQQRFVNKPPFLMRR